MQFDIIWDDIEYHVKGASIGENGTECQCESVLILLSFPKNKKGFEKSYIYDEMRKKYT